MSDDCAASRPVGRAPADRAVGRAQVSGHPATAIIRRRPQPPTPVFVDPSGARHKRLRRLAYLAGAMVVLALLAFWLSQFVSVARPPSVVPCPSAVAGATAVDAGPCR